MDENLAEEIDFVSRMLIKSGFYDEEDIFEILEDQFIEEDIDFDEITLPDVDLNDFNNENFLNLEKTFNELASKDIIAIHNCGYDIEEGVADAFELFIHLRNNKLESRGFCFYSDEDIEEPICEGTLNITFGDFEEDEDKALEIGKVVAEALNNNDFNIEWDETINTQIKINPFKWDKSYDEKEYGMEGAFEVFKKNH